MQSAEIDLIDLSDDLPDIQSTRQDLTSHTSPVSATASSTPAIDECILYVLIEHRDDCLPQITHTVYRVCDLSSDQIHWLDILAAYPDVDITNALCDSNVKDIPDAMSFLKPQDDSFGQGVSRTLPVVTSTQRIIRIYYGIYSHEW